MEQLNTLIELNEIKYQNNNLKFKSCGYLDIKYFGNETNKENEIDLTVEITKEIESLNLNLNLNFSYFSECSRCLNIKNKQDKASFNKNLSTSSENDYDIDINNETIDVLSIVSEVIISKMNLTNREADIIFAIMRELSGEFSHDEVRMRVGKQLLDLFEHQQLMLVNIDQEFYGSQKSHPAC